ncbi:RNA 2',3'-cyclic phosphodiesterase [Pseudooceanicola sp. LIPI14-2-Ac024]|uniref:RNA 2',3'-cyclic phosphodiesterase n=1 Tax=Pseudooceanicola sp. LIPI14-2-Ac024 TaxID=3344875 RepID=UPI0035D0AD49
MRLFIAIDLPEDVRDALAAVQGDLTVGRKTDPDTFHLTLAFLGDHDEATAEEVDLELQGLSAPAFDLAIAGMNTFGGAEPAVLWAGVAEAGPVTDLHKAVRRRVRAAGIELDRERFRPHVTLARFRKRMDAGGMEGLRLFLARNAGFRSDPFRVHAFALYQSDLGGDGPLHTELARYPLTSWEV